MANPEIYSLPNFAPALVARYADGRWWFFPAAIAGGFAKGREWFPKPAYASLLTGANNGLEQVYRAKIAERPEMLRFYAVTEHFPTDAQGGE